MGSNMDMDMAWCLLCSKRTRDTRTLYCSDECRQNDISKADSPPPLTSPLPPLMSVTVSGSSTSTPPRKASTSPVKKPQTHSPLIPAVDLTAPSNSSGMVPQAAPVASLKFQRDRRAFSFPNSQLNDTPTRVPKSRQQSINAHHALPPFVRKSSVAMPPTTSASPRLESIDESLLRPVAPGQKLSKSTGGANTPIKYDTVFCSTSESSDNEALGQSPVQDARPVPKLTMTTLSPKQTVSTLPTESNLSTLRSQLSPRQNSHLRLREASQSPVAALIASSASSRSREDIISWAKAISVRDTSSDDDDAAQTAAEPRRRGRSRTRRESKPSLPPHTETGESEAEHDGSSTGPGTTPKGRIGSSLAGLALAPIVKVLSSAVSSPQQPSQGPSTSSLGLQSVPVPAAAEVSRIAVVAMTAPPEEHSDAPPSMLLGGATPTLSTISFSEAAIDNTDSQVDVITDYQSSAPSDYFHRRASVPAKPKALGQARASQASVATPGTPGTGSPRLSRPKSRSSLPLRPISNTASAIWNLSSYIRSFAPFSISSVMGPYAPFAAAQDSSSSLPTPATTTPSTLLSPSESAYATAPLPAQSRPDSPESPEQEMVRSLPMDIIVPPAVASEERARQPSIARSRRSRSRSRSIQAPTPSTRAQSPARQAAYEHELCDKLGGGADLAATARRDHQCYYDADGSGDEDLAVSRRSDDRRGRSRKGKKLGSPRLLGAMTAGREGRSRGREREASEADSRPRGRGRDRSVRPL